MPDTSPLVTICIPTFNDVGVVRDALGSALRQTYRPLEILVIDNHSTDGTWDVVNAHSAHDARVRCLRQERNIGMAANFNTCIEAAAGEFLLLLCSDDVLTPNAVSLLAEALYEHPNATLVAGARIEVDHSLKERRILKGRSSRQEVGSSELLRECFAFGNRIGEPSGVMFRRSAATRGFNARYSQAIDLEMWFHLLESGSAVLIPEAACLIRRHSAQTTSANMQSGRIVADKRLLFREYAERLAPILTVAEKFGWDVRMASSIGRLRADRLEGATDGLREVFFPRLFFSLLCPLLNFAWGLQQKLGDQRL